jgi:hypothetical protein
MDLHHHHSNNFFGKSSQNGTSESKMYWTWKTDFKNAVG